MVNHRLKQLQKSLRQPILIKKKENLFYLTGRSFDVRAEEYLLVTKKYAVGFGSGLEQISWVKKADRLKNIGRYLKGFKQLDIEYGFTYGEGEYLKFKLKNQKSKIKIKPDRSPVDVMRQVKEPEELQKIKKSMQIVEQVFLRVKKQINTDIKPISTEKTLADFITKMGYKMGAEDVSFPAIVASGPNAAIPHHLPGNKKLKEGESIILDFGFSAGGGSAFGGKLPGYCSDFTRTVFLKKVPKNLEIAYNQVEKAYKGSMEFINSSRPPLLNRGGKGSGSPSLHKRGQGGVTGNSVYQKSVDILAQKHLDKYFIHSLGHGTGLEIHELPNLSPNSKDVLQDNMVFSIEPGVYLPKKGGIRIEDLVYMENGKVKKFINVSTKLKDNIL